ncbi:MAG: hypothetical protein JWM77_3216 [Rhodospirillales bacterium]|jgi:hypothetical protein|nr:hypothetical protein [Rhodospirillales bacterium]
MRAMMLLLGLVMLASTAHAVPYDRATVRLARVEPLLAVPAVPSVQTAPVAVPPRPAPRRERTS